MRMKWGVVFLILAAALIASGCGSKKKSASNTSTTTSTQTSKANQTFKAPAAKQPSSVTGKPSKKTIDQLPKAKQETTAKSPQLKGLEGQGVEQKLRILSGDIAAFWQDGFTRAGVQFPQATVNIITSSQQIACNPPGTIDTNSKYATFYCPDDTSINLPVGTLTRISEDQNYGDAVVAAHIAVSFGFHIEHALSLDKNASDDARLETATCLSGVWMRSIYKRGLLDNGDLQKIASGYPNSNANALVDAFNAGYTTGNPGNCVKSRGIGGPKSG